MGNSVALKGEDEEYESGVVKNWQSQNVDNIKIQNSENEQSEILLTLLALGEILVPNVNTPS